jgi:hypothetical protein
LEYPRFDGTQILFPAAFQNPLGEKRVDVVEYYLPSLFKTLALMLDALPEREYGVFVVTAHTLQLFPNDAGNRVDYVKSNVVSWIWHRHGERNREVVPSPEMGRSRRDHRDRIFEGV